MGFVEETLSREANWMVLRALMDEEAVMTGRGVHAKIAAAREDAPSASTVQKALDELVARGWLTRESAIGSRAGLYRISASPLLRYGVLPLLTLDGGGGYGGSERERAERCLTAWIDALGEASGIFTLVAEPTEAGMRLHAVPRAGHTGLPAFMAVLADVRRVFPSLTIEISEYGFGNVREALAEDGLRERLEQRGTLLAGTPIGRLAA